MIGICAWEHHGERAQWRLTCRDGAVWSFCQEHLAVAVQFVATLSPAALPFTLDPIFVNWPAVSQ